ncbi:hypothetical protein M3Y97_00935100 [Aphelenchoides bicaudatus]|nr:hypothetical protein M3Y97_00935100 [Aphelenchoides bicaudatus]
MQSHAKVGEVYERLQRFRAEKEEEKRRAEQLQQEENDRLERQRIEEEARANAPKKLSFLESLSIDLLDVYPLRKWRQFNDQYPLQCQILAIHVQFGLVFAITSLFVLMFLHLGVRGEGEMSAYSVFNPNCERLLGQLTPEHFERDMLMQRRDDDN